MHSAELKFWQGHLVLNQTNSTQHLPKLVLPILAAIIAVGPFSLDAYLPAFPYIAEDLSISPVAVGYSLSAYLIGMALGQLLGGPISDQIGRRKIAVTGMVLFVLASLAILYTKSLEYLIAARVLQALGGGLASSIVMPTIRDLSSPEKLASRLALVYLIMLMAPLVAPLIGVGLMQLGWRWIFGFLGIYVFLLLCAYSWLLDETRVERQKKINFRKIFSQYRFVITHKLEGIRTPIKYGMSASLSSCIMLIYVTNASFIFQIYFGVSDILFPVFFAINVVALALVQSFSARYLRNRSLVQVASYFRFGQRLQLTAISLMALVVIFGGASLWVIVPLLVITLSCLGINGSAGSGVFLAAFNQHSGSASSILTTGTFVFGAIFGGLSGLLNRGDLSSVVLVMLTASLLANLLLLLISREREAQLLEKIQSGEIEAV